MSGTRLTAWRVCCLSTLAVVLLYFATSQTTLWRNLEAKALDLRFHLRGPKAARAPVVLVAIDDQSIAALGRWPWSRQHFADIVRRLHSAGARVIAFDLLFTEPEATSEQPWLQGLRQALQAPAIALQPAQLEALVQLLQQLQESSGADVGFAVAMGQAGNVVLPFAMPLNALGSAPISHLPLPAALNRAAYRVLQHLEPEQAPAVLHGNAILSPIEPIAHAAAALGHVSVAFDSDGTPRYAYPVVEYAGDYYPSFDIQIVRTYLGLRPEEVIVRFGEGIQVGPMTVPTDESMRLLVNYLGPPGSFATYSFADVLQGRVQPSNFRDTIVLIGGTASGLADTFGTPFSAALSGIERHATLIDNILQQNFLSRRQTTALLDLAAIILWGCLVGWLSPKCPLYWGSVAAFGLAGVWMAVNALIFIQARLWLNLLFPLLAIAVNQSSLTLWEFLQAESQRRQIRRAFQYYLHPSVVDQVSQHPHLLTLGGESRELTVLFSDIRNFSTMAENWSPEVLVQLLNDYLTTMTRVIFRYNGLLDKYIGDGIMAVYGAPVHEPEHAYQACLSALDMMAEVRALQVRWAAQGLPFLNIGIGINTATMVVGNMGSEQRFDYTVMGDGVNLASRLEDVNKEYGTNIIVSEFTWAQVRDRIASRELDTIRVKGRTEPTRIFEVIGKVPLAPQRAVMIETFTAGLHTYRLQQWHAAGQQFQRVLEAFPDDAPSRLYLQRCLAFTTTPPPSDWDGVYSMHRR